MSPLPATSTASGPNKKTRSDGRAYSLIGRHSTRKKGLPGPLHLSKTISKPRVSASADVDQSIPFEERLQLVRTARVTQLAQRLRLDLTDPLTRHVELLADFFERVIGIHIDTKPHAQHLCLARRQLSQHRMRGFAQ